MSKKKSPEQWEILRFLNHVQPYNDAHRKALYRALQFLYERQTYDERDSHRTHHHNEKGFNAFDAELLTGIAKKCRTKGILDKEDVKTVARKLTKYTGQLVELMKQREPKQLDLLKGN